MHRRTMLAAPLAAPLLTTTAGAQAPQVVMEEFMVPAKDPGIEIFVRNKRPAGDAAPRPDRTLLFVHGATYPASTAFDLPLGGLSWMDYIAGRGFERSFQLAEHVEVKAARLENGLLHVDLERIVPEEKKPRRITINAPDLRAIEGHKAA